MYPMTHQQAIYKCYHTITRVS